MAAKSFDILLPDYAHALRSKTRDVGIVMDQLTERKNARAGSMVYDFALHGVCRSAYTKAKSRVLGYDNLTLHEFFPLVV